MLHAGIIANGPTTILVAVYVGHSAFADHVL